MAALEVLLFFAGIGLIIIGISMNQRKCPPQEVKYIPIPRTFKEEQESPIPPSEIFADMFTKPTPFVAGFSIDANPRTINKNFISQI